MLLPNGAPSVQIDVHAAPGYEPHALSLNALKTQYERLIQKPVAIDVIRFETNATSEMRWTVTELEAVAERLHAISARDDTAVLVAATLPGCADYDAGDNRDCIEGGAIGDVGFVFTDPKRGFLADVRYGHPSGHHEAERYLLIHELAHVVGLVSSGIEPARPHVYEDPCRCHSKEEDSVMYGVQRSQYLGNPSQILERFSEDNFYHYTFGEQDLADVQAYVERRSRE